MTTAHDTSDLFSEETLREQKIFQYAKDAEMKEMLGNLADGQIEFYKSVRAFYGAISDIVFTVYLTGDGRVGEDYTRHSTYTSGCLVDDDFRRCSCLYSI